MRRRLLSLVLSGALLLGLCMPARSWAEQTAADERTEVEGLVTAKTARMQPDGSVRLRLESYVTGATVTSPVQREVPADIVLVLDQSGSMASDMGTAYEPVYQLKNGGAYYVSAEGAYRRVRQDNRGQWYYEKDGSAVYVTAKTSLTDEDAGHTQFYAVRTVSRKEALQAAARAFAESVAQRATAEANHRIAVLGFASGKEYQYGNTELFVGGTAYQYARTAQAHYKDALQDMSTRTGRENVAASIDALSADGGTRTNLGIEMAQGVFDAGKDASVQRSRVMIVFTDGQPGDWGFSKQVANSAISKAKGLKDGGVTVFTVGIFSGANPEDLRGDNNRFMNYLSSNYPAAVSMDSGGAAGEKTGYYLAASSAEGLQNVFQTISDQIQTGGAALRLDAETRVQDGISDYFVLPQTEEERNITVKTASFTGYDTDGKTPLFAAETDAGLVPEVSGRQVSVTGFDFGANYVGMDTDADGYQTPHGSKLIVELTVLPRPGFLGGNFVPTNAVDSGIYSGDGTLVEHFPRPTVDVPIGEVTVTAQDRNVYLGGSLTNRRMLEGAEASCGGISLTEELEPWQTAFVTIRMTAEEDRTDVTEDGTYQVTCTVSPREPSEAPGAAVARAGSGAGLIRVFTPQVTLRDETVWYGDDAPVDCMPVELRWMHGQVDSTEVYLEGQAPELTFEAAPVDAEDLAGGVAAVKQDIPMTVRVFGPGREITDRTGFMHQDCTGGCGYEAGQGQYLLHVKTCRLRITKAGGRAGETYVFTILRNGQPYTQARITGDGTAEVYELPVGSYTLEENADWAWRWGSPSYEGAAELTGSQPEGSLLCRNRGRTPRWLSGYSPAVVNLYQKGGEG